MNQTITEIIWFWENLMRSITVQIVTFDFWLQDPSKICDLCFWKCCFHETVSGQWLNTSFHEEICVLPDLCPNRHRAPPIPITALIPTGWIQQTLIQPLSAIKWEKCRRSPDVGMAVEDVRCVFVEINPCFSTAVLHWLPLSLCPLNVLGQITSFDHRRLAASESRMFMRLLDWI